MSSYRKRCVLILIIEIAVAVATIMFAWSQIHSTSDREYRVEVKRVSEAIAASDSDSPCEDIDLSSYEYVTDIREFDPQELPSGFTYVTEAGGKRYTIEYRVTPKIGLGFIILTVGFGSVILLSLGLMIYVGRNIISPFQRMNDLPYELAKGNLTMPVKENKNKFFGRYLWGMDMLRTNLEESKDAEYRLMRDKKTLVLSLAHDVKTPLTSIRLYSKGLQEGLFETEAQRKDAICGIEKNAAEIEHFISEIMRAENEDFLKLEVHPTEVYFSTIIERVTRFYRDKLSVSHTDFVVGECTECLVQVDEERLIEVIQNLIENAIKYGDGQRIELSFSQEDNCQLIHIHNTGDPIPEEELPHIFHSFYRGSNAGNKKGNGLGLYIARQLMRKMDGDVYAKTGDRSGMVFTVVVRMA